jgi:hypothetical protein
MPLFAKPRSTTQLQARGDAVEEMGIAAGGSIKQQILEDEYGIETWDATSRIALNIHIVNSLVYEEISGRSAPETPITAEKYAKQGIPWYEHYDETRRTVSGPKIFDHLLPVAEIEKARGQQAVELPPAGLTRGPLVPVTTPTLAERVNALRESVKTTYEKMQLSECIAYARICGELIERHKDELSIVSPSNSIEELAAESFTIAGECCARFGKMDDAEDFANRSLLLSFTERGLSLRLFSKVQSHKWEEAEEDCKELLHRNPSHDYANQILTFLGSEETKSKRHFL